MQWFTIITCGYFLSRMTGKRLSLELRQKVIKFHQKGLGYKKIADKLVIRRTTVQNIVKKFKKFGTVADLGVSGRPRCTTRRIDRQIISKIGKNPRLSASTINKDMNKEHNIHVSNQTIRNRIHQEGFKGRSPRKKPFLTKRHIARRFAWAKKYESWTLEDWKRVLWSDETKVNLFGSDGVTHVWRKAGDADKAKYCKPTVKHGGGHRMVWACMSWKGVGNFEIIDGIMNSNYYRDILDRNLLASKRKLRLVNNFTFQQDGDSKHTSKLLKNWFTSKKIKVMDWPPQSPDMNVIEQLWSIIKPKISLHNPKNVNELDNAIKIEWEQLDTTFTNSLVESMPKRVLALLKARGGHTKY